MLLIGNGVSRLQDYVIQYINDWEDDIWIFNLGYLDFGKRATRWSGHKELIEVVYQYKQFHKAKYIIYTNECGRAAKALQHRRSGPPPRKEFRTTRAPRDPAQKS